MTDHNVDTSELLKDVDSHSQEDTPKDLLAAIAEQATPPDLRFSLFVSNRLNHDVQRFFNVGMIRRLSEESCYHSLGFGMPIFQAEISR